MTESILLKHIDQKSSGRKIAKLSPHVKLITSVEVNLNACSGVKDDLYM